MFNNQINHKLTILLIKKGMPIHHTNDNNTDNIQLHEFITFNDVFQWIYKKHNIWITAKPTKKHSHWKAILYQKNKDVIHSNKTFKTYTEAYEEAINLTINIIN